MSSIQASQQQLKHIFNITSYQFEIPPYQRPYAWTKDQVLELIDDLLDAFPYPDEDSPNYFFGSIILIKEVNKPNAEVIDGQQRLTTLTLLLSVFRHLLPSKHKICHKIGDFLEGEDITGDQTLYGLKLHPQDDVFFGATIRTSGGMKQLLKQDAGLKIDSQILLRDNARIFVKELTERCPEGVSMESWILHLYKNILEKCYLVIVSTSDFETAYRIFSTINTRGLDLQLNDILKAEIIGKIEGDKEKYTRIWEGEESDLGRKDFEMLFSHIHRIKTKERAKESLLTQYRKKIRPQDNPIQFIDEILKPCSDMFEIIRDQRFTCDNEKDKKDINQLFGWLNRIDNSDWLPPGIYFLVKHHHQTEQIKAFFIQLERLAAGLMILKADINRRAKCYAQVLSAIDEGAKAAIKVTQQLLSPEEQKAIMNTLNGDLYSENRSRLYVLMRLDSALTDGGLSPSFDAKMVTIEHVLPQNPKTDSDWCKNWSNDERQKSVHRLGNLVLLPRKKNSEAQNYDFETKKTKYFNPKDVVPFPITINVINQHKWTRQEVEDNQKKYLAKLKELWNLSS
jgi:hypothetical protein